MSEEARRELEEIKTQLNTLMYRVRDLERRMAMESRSAETPQSATPRPAPAPPVSGPLAPANEREMRSLEQALGGKVALYTGVTLLFLATAFFLGWAWVRLTPEGRLALGYLGGFALMGLGMLALTTSKLFLYDLGFLEMPYRALSFAGLGLALIGVAWLYGRYGRTQTGNGAAQEPIGGVPTSR